MYYTKYRENSEWFKQNFKKIPEKFNKVSKAF